jgi:hypothetical protein
MSSFTIKHHESKPLSWTWRMVFLWTFHAILVVTILVEILSGDYLWAADALLALALCCLPSAIFHKEDKMAVTNIEIVFLAMAIGNCTLGVAGNLYRLLPYYDKILHVINPAALAYCTFLFLWTIVGARHTGLSPVGLAVVITLIVLGASTIWEFAEFVSDQLARTSTQGSPLMAPLDDTMWDLILSFFGGLAGTFAGALAVMHARRTAGARPNQKGYLL